MGIAIDRYLVTGRIKCFLWHSVWDIFESYSIYYIMASFVVLADWVFRCARAESQQLLLTSILFLWLCLGILGSIGRWLLRVWIFPVLRMALPLLSLFVTPTSLSSSQLLTLTDTFFKSGTSWFSLSKSCVDAGFLEVSFLEALPALPFDPSASCCDVFSDLIDYLFYLCRVISWFIFTSYD